jgi:hypothetical protein
VWLKRERAAVAAIGNRGGDELKIKPLRSTLHRRDHFSTPIRTTVRNLLKRRCLQPKRSFSSPPNHLNIAINFARDSTPSFRKTELNGVLIMSTLSLGRLATSALLCPLHTSRAISRSRGFRSRNGLNLSGDLTSGLICHPSDHKPAGFAQQHPARDRRGRVSPRFIGLSPIYSFQKKPDRVSDPFSTPTPISLARR